MLDNKGNRHTLRICNTSCFSMAKMVTRTPVNITFICALPCLFRHIIFTCYSSSLSNFRYSAIFSKDSQPLLRHAITSPGHTLLGVHEPRAPKTCGSSVRNLFHVVILVPWILKWLLDVWKIWIPMGYTISPSLYFMFQIPSNGDGYDWNWKVR